MPISVACLTCGTKLAAPDASAGKWVKCVKCLAFIALPAKVILDAEVVEYDDPPPVKVYPSSKAEQRKPDRDDSDDDRPARKPRRRRKPPKKGDFPIVPALVAGGLVFLFVAVGIVTWYLAPRDKPGAKGAPSLSPFEQLISPTPAGSVDAAELQKLQGNWKVIRGVRNGVEAPVARVEQQPVILNVQGTVMTMSGFGKTNSSTIVKLDPRPFPKHLDVSAATTGRIELGIYSLDGDELRLKTSDGGRSRDSSWDASGGDEALLVFKRQ